MDLLKASQAVDEAITAEIAHQNNRFGPLTARQDIVDGQFFYAAIAQSDALLERRLGDVHAFEDTPIIYPEGWSGFRDYGSDFANLAVTAAFIQQEMIRLVMNGEDTTRLERRVDQPYAADAPLLVT